MKLRWSSQFLLRILLAVVLSVLMVSSAFAAGAPGSGPDNALVPTGGTQALAMGQRVWYAFQSGGDNTEPIQIQLSANPQGSAAFSVWTPDNVRNWQAGNTEEPVGRGTTQIINRGTDNEQTLYGGDLLWKSVFNTPATYYVVVDQTGPVAGAYRLTITGSDVALGAPQLQSVSAQNNELPAPQTLPSTGNQQSNNQANNQAPSGAQPASALPLPNDVQTLSTGQQRWYVFQNGGSDYQTLIQLSATPQGSASFSVWDKDRLAAWQSSNDFKPLGRGTVSVLDRNGDNPRPLFNGDPVWSGSVPVSGPLYVRVDQQGSTPASFRLNLTQTFRITSGTTP
jgi:hypothetical protein